MTEASKETAVSIPETRLNLSPENYAILWAQIDPLAPSDNFAHEKCELHNRLY